MWKRDWLNTEATDGMTLPLTFIIGLQNKSLSSKNNWTA